MNRGQTTLILMLFAVLIFIGMAIFLLYFAKQLGSPEYLDLYAHELLITALRSDASGPECPLCWQDRNCRDVMSLLKSIWKLGSGYLCRSAGPDWPVEKLALARLNHTLWVFSQKKPGYDYFLAVRFPTTGEWLYVNISRDDSLLKWYRCLIGESRTGCRLRVSVAHQVIPVSGTETITATLAISKKRSI